ncbi:hypothetical protein [Thermithiobacillus plumbiphilus]|uniref:PhnA-like protein n=1 Tax=Thermithiobacillus plumbiphilus TaxID=1729899 RepID=A0ABU9DB34_9PROT
MSVITEDVLAEERQPAQISWGAIFAGLVFTFALAWLLNMLGSALGFSIVGASDGNVSGKGLAYGAAFWIFVSWIASMFLGGLLAGRLAGKPEKAVGMLHGVTLWGVVTLAVLVLGSMGLSNLLQTGQNLISGAAGMGAQAAGGASGGAAQNPVVSQMAGTAQSEMTQRLSQALAQAADQAGPNGQVSPAEVRRALGQLDQQTLGAIGSDLVRGDTQAAKQTLAANTTLDRAQVNQIIDGAAVQMRQQGSELRTDARQAVDKASEATSAVLWVVFGSSAIGLLMAILGGWMGASTIARIYNYRLY